MAHMGTFGQNKKLLCKYGSILPNFLHTYIIEVL